MGDIQVVHAALSDVGRVRSRNEDDYLAVPEARLFAVADGLGGHAAGEVASRLALSTLGARLGGEGPAGAGPKTGLEAAIRAANRAVLEAASADARLEGMGTTITALHLNGEGGFVIGHVGDSRAYRLREGELKRLTRDHTYVQEMVERGQLTDEQARLHPRSSVLTRALGLEEAMEVEMYDGRSRPDDRFLLATDGLTGLLSADELAELVAAEDDPDGLARALVAAANAAGGRDNITVVVIDVLGG